MLRICPTFAAATPAEVTRQFHVEFRATDAAASPYLALGAVIFAGVDGLRRGLELQTSGAPKHLPQSLPEALDRLAADQTVAGWFGPTHFDAYIRFKRVEAEKVAGLSPAGPRPMPPASRWSSANRRGTSAPASCTICPRSAR